MLALQGPSMVIDATVDRASTATAAATKIQNEKMSIASENETRRTIAERFVVRQSVLFSQKLLSIKTEDIRDNTARQVSSGLL